MSRLPLRPGGGRGRGKLGRPGGAPPAVVVREGAFPPLVAEASCVSICSRMPHSKKRSPVWDMVGWWVGVVRIK